MDFEPKAFQGVERSSVESAVTGFETESSEGELTCSEEASPGARVRRVTPWRRSHRHWGEIFSLNSSPALLPETKELALDRLIWREER